MNNSHPATVTVAALFVLLVAYMLIDPLVSREVFTQEPRRLFPVLGLIGIVAAIVTAVILRRVEVPGAEAIAVGVLFGAAFGAAGYPTAIHLNRWLDPIGLKTYEYRVVVREPVIFEPVESGLPKIDYFKRTAYWERFTPDMRIPVRLRRGGLGIWQFHIDDIVADIRRFQRGEKPVLGNMAKPERPEP